MKKIFITTCILCAILLSSCKLAIIPTAINTVNSVTLEELNLERKDYKILNTISADASITYRQIGANKIIIEDPNGEFKLKFKRTYSLLKGYSWQFNKFEGIARYGFLTNDYKNQNLSFLIEPESIARNLAIYRLINACKVAGGDGVIEPIVSTNVGQEGNKIIFKTTVSAKIIKLNTDK